MKKKSNKKAGQMDENIDESSLEFYNDDTPNEFNSDSSNDFEAQAGDIIKNLKKKLKECEREKIENLTGWQRSKADYVNLKKRGSISGEQVQRQTKEAVIQSFFPVLDSFEVAMKGEAWEGADEKWKTGINSIYKQFLSALETNGVEEVGSVGEHFDPYIHTSVSLIETTESDKDHTIAEVLQKGYRFKTGEIIRSPKVVVYEKNT